MSFMSSLAANPSGSGIYGQPGQDQDILGVVNQLKDREMRDFKDKSNFMADLSIKQDRLRNRFNFEDSWMQTGKNPGVQDQQGSQQGQNTVMARNPNEMTGYEKGELGIRQQQLGQASQRIAQQGKLSQGALDIKQQQTELNQQKSDQINANKQADVQRKIDDSSQKFAAIQAELERKTKAGEDTSQTSKDLAAAVEERHKAERAMTQHKMDTQDEQFKKLRDEHNALIKQNSRTIQTKRDSAGNEITTETSKGDEADMVDVIGPSGQKGRIPRSKLNDWNKNHAPQQER